MKQRILFLDIAKGLLILFLLLHHVPFQGGYVVSPAMESIKSSVVFYGPFFMSAFFIISGYCTNFNKKFVQFLLSSVKGILLPAFTFSVISSIVKIFVYDDLSIGNRLLTTGFYLFPSGFWFFAALFEVRLLLWIINKLHCVDIVVLFVSFVIGFGGLYINKLGDIPQYSSFLSYQHAMMALPFVAIGSYLKGRELDLQIKCAGIAYLVIFTLMTLIGKPTPTWTFVMAMKPYHYPLFVLLAITGSSFIIWVSKLIGRNNILEFVGKNSLVFYGMNFVVLDILRPLFAGIIAPNGYFDTGLWFILVYISAFAVLCMLVLVFNTFVGKIFLGKF